MYYEHGVEAVINQFIKDSGLAGENLVFRKKKKYGKDADSWSRGIMTFKSKTNHICYCLDRLNSQKLKMPYLSAGDYLIALFVHELGHYFHFKAEKEDVDRLKEEHKNSKDIKWKYPLEFAAWQYGKPYVPEHLQEAYDWINRINLYAYEAENLTEERLKEREIEFYMNIPVDRRINISKSALGKVIEWPISYMRKYNKDELIRRIGEFLDTEEDGCAEFYNEYDYLVVKQGSASRLIKRSLYDFFEVKGCYELIGENKIENLK